MEHLPDIGSTKACLQFKWLFPQLASFNMSSDLELRWERHTVVKIVVTTLRRMEVVLSARIQHGQSILFFSTAIIQ